MTTPNRSNPSHHYLGSIASKSRFKTQPSSSYGAKRISSHAKPPALHLRISVPDNFELRDDEHEIKECNLHHPALFNVSSSESPLTRSVYSSNTAQTHSTIISKVSSSNKSKLPYSPLNPEQAKRHSIRSFDAVKIMQCAHKNKKSNCVKGRTSNHSKSNQSNSQNRRQYNSGGNGDNNNNRRRRNNNGCNGNGNKRNGDDEEKRERDKIIDEEDDDDEEDTEDEENDEMDENDDDDEKHILSRKASILKPHIYKSKSCETRPKHSAYSYTPYDTVRIIKMSKHLTKTAIPQRIKERILDVYDFINKMTAICLYDRYFVDVGNCMILNFGFHDRQNNAVLYLVAKFCKKVQRCGEYVMYQKLYTKEEIYKLYGLRAYQLPAQWRNDKAETHDLNAIAGALSDMNYVDSMAWHKLEVMRVNKHNKATEFNKQHITFYITKPQFIASFKRAKKSALIPITMFIGNGHRVEFLQIVRIKDNIDIGISYIIRNKCVQATAIHLNKDMILQQHQLATKHHDCNCLGDFRSIIEDIHIGNPDDDKNRVKDLQNKNYGLKQQLNNRDDEIQQLKHEIDLLKRENVEVHTLRIKVDTLQDLWLQRTHIDSFRSLTSASNSATTPISANMIRFTPLPQSASVTPVATFTQPIGAYFSQQPPLQANSKNVTPSPHTGVAMSYTQYTNTLNANRQYSLSNTPQSATSMNNNNNNHSGSFTPFGTLASIANVQQNMYSSVPVMHDHHHHHQHHKRNNNNIVNGNNYNTNNNNNTNINNNNNNNNNNNLKVEYGFPTYSTSI